MYTLQRSKSHGFGAMHLKDIIIIIIQTKIKNIMLMVYSECVIKVEDSDHFSG